MLWEEASDLMGPLGSLVLSTSILLVALSFVTGVPPSLLLKKSAVPVVWGMGRARVAIDRRREAKLDDVVMPLDMEDRDISRGGAKKGRNASDRKKAVKRDSKPSRSEKKKRKATL